MPSIADAVTQIQAADLPVLFADTCILVDVIRAPGCRFESYGGHRQHRTYVDSRVANRPSRVIRR
jgi:hypothetical protein